MAFTIFSEPAMMPENIWPFSWKNDRINYTIIKIAVCQLMNHCSSSYSYKYACELHNHRYKEKDFL